MGAEREEVKERVVVEVVGETYLKEWRNV